MTTTEAAAYKSVGTRPIRHDGYDKVTGRAAYGSDISLPGMLHAKILRSPHAHAVIKSVDTSRAEAAPGVHAVITSADLPEYENKPVTGPSGGPPQNPLPPKQKDTCQGQGFVQRAPRRCGRRRQRP